MQKAKVILAVIAAVAGLSVLSTCGSNSKATPTNLSEPTPVRVESIGRTAAGLPIRAVGRLEAKEEFRLAFKIAGIVDRVFVDEGDQVRKGQRLASLSLTEINAALSQAQNNFDKAERDFDRYQQLYADSLITLEQMQNASTAREVAKATLDAARFNRRHAEIVAPSDGRVIRRLFDGSELVAAGSPIVVVSGYGRGWVVRVSLADRDLVRIKRGDSAAIEFDALPGIQRMGVISEVGAAPNPANGTYEVEISVESSQELLSGLIAKVSIQSLLNVEAAVIPVEALVTADGQKGFVFVPSENQQTVAKVPVTIAYFDGNRVAVSGEVQQCAEVITAGAAKLSDGSPVAIIR